MALPLIPAAIGTKKALAGAGALGGAGFLKGRFGGQDTPNEQEQSTGDQITKKSTSHEQSTFSPQTTISPQRTINRDFSPQIQMGSPNASMTSKKQQQAQPEMTSQPRQTARPVMEAPVTTTPTLSPEQGVDQSGDTGQNLVLLGLIAGGSYVALEVLN